MNRQWRPTASALLAVCALIVGLTACGAPSKRVDAASGAATTFEKAVSGGNRTAMCAALAPQTRSEVEDSEKKVCTEAISEEDLSDGGAVRRVDVWGHQARAVLAADTLFLSQFPGGWKIVAAGCRPQPGKPYQCSVKGG
ncbi:hypothetical protein ABZ341_36020 [Streptomyces sp. NPDC006173]|uniref:hypothetical protein n=1 Tax=Streptomyces sp. NPDC006173 TaxID=3155349 RepID=UPI003402A2DE